MTDALNSSEPSTKPAPTPNASPYANRKVTPREHLLIASYWFAVNFHWGALLLILLPGDVRQMVPFNRAEALGWITAIGAIPALLVPLISGVLSDRCRHRLGRRRPYITAGIWVNLVGLAGMAFTVTAHKSLGQPLAWYVISFIIVQVGNNISSGAYMGLIPDLIDPDQRGAASGYMALLSQVGTLLGAVAVGLFLGELSPLVKYGVVAAILLIVGYIVRYQVQENQWHEVSEKMDWVKYVKSLWIDPRQYPDFAWVWFTRFLVMLGFYAILPFLNYYLVDVVGVSSKKVDEVAPMLSAVILVIASISGYLGGIVSDKIGRKKVVYWANALIAVVAPTFVFATSIPQAILIGGLFGLGYGAYISVDYALGTDVLPNKAEAGKDMAVWHIAMTLPQSIVAPIAAFLIALPGKTVIPPTVPGEDQLVKYTQLGYGYVFVLCSVCFALGAFLLKYVRGVK